MAIYLIKHGADKHVIEAGSQIEAIGCWMDRERRRNAGFKSGDFSIGEIKTKFGLIQANKNQES